MWSVVFFFNDTATPEIYSLSLHDALPICFWPYPVTKLAGGLLFFLPLPYICGSHYITLHYFTLLYITLHYLGHFSLLYSTCVRFMVAGGDLFVTPPLWHPASVAVRTLS